MFNTCNCAPNCPDQWLFLGVSIRNYSIQMGWGDGASSLTVDLVEDTEPTCDGRFKKHLDEKFIVQETTAPDSGFFGLQNNIIGRPVLFRHEDFEFGGIVSDWNESNSSSGIRIYTVTVEAPTQVLASLNMIIDSYDGDVSAVPNTANIYGFYERQSCDSFGDSKNFGNGMAWNKIKAALAVLTSAIDPLLISVSGYLQNGRVKLVQGLNGGCGLVREDDIGYLLDLGELPLAPDYYRFSGVSLNLLDAINNLAEDAAINWFAELILCCINDVVYKIIKIRTVDRSIPPVPDAVRNFVTLYNNSSDKCGVIDYSVGQEHKDDYLHGVLIGPNREQIYTTDWTRAGGVPVRTYQDVSTGESTGQDVEFKSWLRLIDTGTNLPTVIASTATVSRIKYITSNIPIDTYDLSDDLISPYWGLDTDGNTIMSYSVDFFPEDTGFSTGPLSSPVFFLGNSASLNDKFFLMSAPNFLEVSEPEILASLGGYDQWESYISQANTQTYQIVKTAKEFLNLANGVGLHNLNHLINLYKGSISPVLASLIKPMHMLALRRVSSEDPLYNQIENDNNILFNWVAEYASTYYGRQFMIRVPEICVTREDDTQQFKFSYEVSDGGWNEFNDVEYTTLLGINIPSQQIDFFRGSDGRIKSFCKFENANLLIFDNLSDNDYGYIDGGGGTIWVKCDVDPEIKFGDYSNFTDPRVVIHLPDTIRLKQDNVWVKRDGSITSINQGPNIRWSTGVQSDWSSTILKSVGSASKTAFLSERAIQPNSICFGIRNNTKVYGPWFATNGTSIGGGVNIEEDANLTPWAFGSKDILESVASAQVLEGVSNMYYSESGSITIPGSPTGRIGDELLSINGLGYISGQFYANSRVVETNIDLTTGLEYIEVHLIKTTFRWVGNYGPIINSISTRVGPSGMTTTLNMSNYRKKLKRFSKVRLNQTKEIGRLRQDILKNNGRV